MKLFNKHTFRKIFKAILLTLIFLFLIKKFVFETYSLSTSQMSTSLLEGDEVLVSKLSYGPRVPSTILSLPFFSNVYSSLISLPYYRLFPAAVQIDDIVLFNSPNQLEKPVDKRDLLISRCIATPGDTITIVNDIYHINNKQYHKSPYIVYNYIAQSSDTALIRQNAELNDIDLIFEPLSDTTVRFEVSRSDAYILGQMSGKVFTQIKDINFDTPIHLIVPKAGAQVKLTANNIKLYNQVLEYENPGQISVEDDKIFVNDEETDFYTFGEDYYWFLSDNINNSIDSRVLGFIPYSSIEGRVVTVLYNNKNMGRFFKTVN